LQKEWTSEFSFVQILEVRFLCSFDLVRPIFGLINRYCALDSGICFY